ncbi:MAG: hypothetical protein P8M79_03330 [Alphaproteobacteria bacterium]|nr:hypothetical protein [Alphaproteobacteria bacterium]
MNELPGGIGKQNLRLLSYFLNGLCMAGRGMRSIRAARHPEPIKPLEMSGFQNAPMQVVLTVIEWSFPQRSFPAPSRAGTSRSILDVDGYPLFGPTQKRHLFPYLYHIHSNNRRMDRQHGRRASASIHDRICIHYH